MKKNIYIVLASVIVAGLLMSGGYGVWEKSIVFSGDVEVAPAPILVVKPTAPASGLDVKTLPNNQDNQVGTDHVSHKDSDRTNPSSDKKSSHSSGSSGGQADKEIAK